ncbi:MAG: hypothetical protein ACE5HN_05395 [Nitrospiria bacterium]
MSITIFQVQNVLRTYNRLLKSKLIGPEPNNPKGEPSPRGTSPIDRVTISEETRRKLAELNASTKEDSIPDLKEGSSEEDSA